MGMLDRATRGKVKRPLCLLIYGPDGVGKTMFASQAPNPIFLGPENGNDQLDVARFPTPEGWNDVLSAVKELISLQHDYQTLVIDSVDWMEPMIYQFICKKYNVASIELAAGGYGKGYAEALNKWLELKNLFEELRNKKSMNIILIGHSDLTTFNDPQTQAQYQRYELKLHKKASAMLREYVDAVLFANYEIFVKRDGDRVVSTHGEGVRIMHTERRPGWDAKNRYGLPLRLELDWFELMKGIEVGHPESKEAIIARMDGMLSVLDHVIVDVPGEAGAITQIPLRDIVKSEIEKAGDDITQLTRLSNRLTIRMGETV